MIEIGITYDHTTRLLSVTGQDCCDAIGGTYGDANSTRLNFTITGVTGQYTVKCALGSPIKNDHEVIFPMYDLVNGSVILSEDVMKSAIRGEIPVQLHFTTSTEKWSSLNVIRLRIMPSIPSVDMDPIEPVPTPTSDIVTDVESDTDVTLTIHYSDQSQKSLPIHGMQLRLVVPAGHDSVDAQTASGTLRLTPQTATHSNVLTLATKEYVDAHAGGSSSYEVTFQSPSDTWAYTIPADKSAVANIQTFIAIGGTWHEAFGDIQQSGRNITIKFNSAISGKMVIS